MTIEIRQLVIRAVVEPPAEAAPGVTPSRLPPAEVEVEARPVPLTTADRHALVNVCVREVLRELKKARGR